ncbi:hypothetical protein [Neobacillus cucumis]|uniref:hypothetical protein n=1 Tax=Neobacillus cucumis TaxID=1740721 RepID=UPI001963245E|nr:hypothetical protein [Neobacillus cucumis]MBM7651843.1 hypothetical protein [Neobacillus cucumis]
MIKEKFYNKPIILGHQPLQFETRHSWNPGVGNSPPSDGNGGIKFPVETNPNPQPCGAGTASNENGNSNGQGNGNIGVGQCNPKVN